MYFDMVYISDKKSLAFKGTVLFMRQFLGSCKAPEAHDLGFAENLSFWKQQICLPY